MHLQSGCPVSTVHLQRPISFLDFLKILITAWMQRTTVSVWNNYYPLIIMDFLPQLVLPPVLHHQAVSLHQLLLADTLLYCPPLSRYSTCCISGCRVPSSYSVPGSSHNFVHLQQKKSEELLSQQGPLYPSKVPMHHIIQ